MTIKAKYPGKCNRCGKKINVGDEIEWDRVSGAAHVKCIANSEAIPEDSIRISGGSGYGYYGWTAGDVVRNPYHCNDRYRVDDTWRMSRYLYIISVKSTYYSEEGMSFGVGDESGYVYSAMCRPATDKESAPLREAEQKHKNIAAAKNQLKEISEKIKNNGERPDGDNYAEGEEISIDVSGRIYGGGDWFVIGKEFIWYVQNNGMDGDNWSNNNVRTGGAGAIGWRIPHTKDMENKIRLAKQCIKSGENIETAMLVIDDKVDDPKLIKKREAEIILKKVFAIRCNNNDYLLTDLEKCYLATNKGAYDEGKFHPEYVSDQNQSWLLYRTDEKPVFPEWFSSEFARNILNSLADIKTGWVKDTLKDCEKGHTGRYASCDWFSACERDAMWLAHRWWTPLSSIKFSSDVIMEYDNGSYDHPIQLWSDGCLSMFKSFEKFGELDKNVMTLLQYAIDSRNSKWRKDKKWRELLNFNGEISEFVSINKKHSPGYEEEKSIALAGQYILIKNEWGGMCGGEGDAGDELLLLDIDDEDYQKYNDCLRGVK